MTAKKAKTRPKTKNIQIERIDEHAIIASICRESFVDFVREFWSLVPGAGRLRWNWHLDVFCYELQTIAERVFAGLPKEYDIALNVSPGTSKSTVWSILFPAWVWTRMPHARVLTASHTDKLVTDLAAKSRSVIKSDKYKKCFPEIKIREDQDTKHYYANTHGGDRQTATVGGQSPMGFHAHFIITDDPIDPQKAASDVELEEARKFILEVIPTRKVDKLTAVTALIMQRIHYRDPTDAMLDQAKREDADRVRHICLPAEENEDIKPVNHVYRVLTKNGYKEKTIKEMYGEGGGLMDPYRLSLNALKPFKARGIFFYTTQFLQRPEAPGIGMFKVHYFNKRVRAAPYHAKRVWFWDRAATEQGGCATAGVLMAMTIDPLTFYIEDCIWGQWEPIERNHIIRSAAIRSRGRYGPKNEPVILVEREGGSSGRDAWLMMARELAGFRFEEIQVTGSKDTRAEPLAAQFAAGTVYLCDNGELEGTGKALWDIEGFVREFVLFRPEPGKRLGGWKDRVDSTSGGMNYLLDHPTKTSFRFVPPGKGKSALKIVVVSREGLQNLLLEEQKCLLIHLTDAPIDNQEASVPGHAINLLLDKLVLSYADIQAQDMQDRWEDILPPYNKKPEDLIMNRDHGKKLWSFLLRKRADTPQLFVIQDEGDRKGVSTAMALCDVMGLKREQTIYIPTNPEDKCAGKAPNEHVYNMVKSTRHLVIS